MKPVLEEYGLVILEFICGIAMIGVLMAAVTGLSELAGVLADKLLGGTP